MSETKEKIKFYLLNYPDMNPKEIAEKVGCSKAYVYKIKRKLEQEKEEQEEEPQFEVEEPETSITEETETEEWQTIEEPITPTTEEIEEVVEEVGFDETATRFLLTLTFDRIADLTEFEGFRLTRDELNQLTPITTKILNKYVPKVIGEYSLELTFIYTVLMIVGGKIALYKRYKQKTKQIVEEKKEEEETKEEEKTEEEVSIEEKKFLEGEKLKTRLFKALER